MRKDIVRKINFLKTRRHQDALRIKRLKRKLDFSVDWGAVGLAGGAIGSMAVGSLMALIINKYVFGPLSKKLDIHQIKSGKIPEGVFVTHFKECFNRGKTIASRIMEPEVWANVNRSNFKDLQQKVNNTRTVRDLVRLFPDCRFLVQVQEAYRQAESL